jgi:hypothetical protein
MSRLIFRAFSWNFAARVGEPGVSNPRWISPRIGDRQLVLRKARTSALDRGGVPNDLPYLGYTTLDFSAASGYTVHDMTAVGGPRLGQLAVSECPTAC